MPRTGGSSRDRRRSERAAERRIEKSKQKTAQARAEVGADEVAVFAELVAAANAPSVPDQSEQDLVREYHALIEGALPDAEARATVWPEGAEFGGKPSKGTDADKRLRANRRAKAEDETAEEFVLESLGVLQLGTRCGCGHSYAEHSGATGSCAHQDGRGTCSCTEFSEAVEALTAAVGDVAWGPEDGFVDLLCDVNKLLSQGGPGPRAIDAKVDLSAVKICDYDDDSYWVAPIKIDGMGEPVLSDRSAWVPAAADGVEEIGEATTAAAELPAAQEDPLAQTVRFALRDIFLTADGATAPALPDEHQPGERIPEESPEITDAPSAAADGGVRWTAKFVPEGSLTDDGRAFAPGALTWRELPLSLMAMIETSAEGGHDGAKLSGRIDRIWREGSDVMASGIFDPGEYGTDIARMVGDGTLRGLSVDIAIHEYEVGPRSDYFNEDGSWRTDRPETPPAEEKSLVDLLFDEAADDEPRVFVVTDGVIGMATVCPFPAFAEANIALVASGAIWRYSHQGGYITVREPAAETLVASAVAEVEPVEAEPVAEVAAAAEPEPDVLTAGAAGLAPLAPPADWFEAPDLDALTPLTIDEHGRIYGHAWAWDSCHLSFPDACVTAPGSETDYAYFHLGEIECADGELLPVGKITIDAPHAGQRLSRGDATAHYDHTGTVAAHVRCGEDEFGGWVAGAVDPSVSEEMLRKLRGSALSGDWRNVNGNLELVALLAVNVPGFPVPRALVAAGAEGDPEVLSLTAAGIVRERTEEDDVADLDAIRDLAHEAAEA